MPGFICRLAIGEPDGSRQDHLGQGWPGNGARALYVHTFGWLTITAGDLDVWKQYPQAAFTLLGQHSLPDAAPGEEFHLGAFDIAPDSPPPFTTH